MLKHAHEHPPPRAAPGGAPDNGGEQREIKAGATVEGVGMCEDAPPSLPLLSLTSTSVSALFSLVSDRIWCLIKKETTNLPTFSF